MAGGALVVASLIPCVLLCVKRKEALASGKENAAHAQEETEQRNSQNNERLSRDPHHSSDTKPINLDQCLFVSAV